MAFWESLVSGKKLVTFSSNLTLGDKKGHKEDAYAEGQVKQDFMPFKIVI